MKILECYKPEKCVNKDQEGKEAFKHMVVERLDDNRGMLNATDGSMLVRIPVVMEDGDEPGSLSVAALEQAREYAKDGDYDIKLRSKAMIEKPEIKAEHARFNFLTIPNFGKAIPKGKPKAVISFDIKKLKAIADAMGTEHVMLEIRGQTDGVVVRPNNAGLEIGVLMPTKIQREVNPEKELA